MLSCVSPEQVSVWNTILKTFAMRKIIVELYPTIGSFSVHFACKDSSSWTSFFFLKNNFYLFFPFHVAPQTKPAYATSAAEVAKELKTQSEDSKSSAVSSDGSLTENGVGNGDNQASQINGGSADTQPPNHSESALSSDSKACNTNPHLNALDPDSGHHEEETLEASVLKKEE